MAGEEDLDYQILPLQQKNQQPQHQNNQKNSNKNDIKNKHRFTFISFLHLRSR